MSKSMKRIQILTSAFLAIVLSLSLVPSVAFATILDGATSSQQAAEVEGSPGVIVSPDQEDAQAAAAESASSDAPSPDEPSVANLNEESEEGEDPFADVSPADLEGDFAKDEVIIVYEDEMIDQQESLDLGDTDADVKLEDLGVVEQEQLVDDSQSASTGDIVLAKLDEETSVEQIAAQLEQVPGIAYVQPNYEYKAATTTVNDTLAPQQYYLTSSKINQAWDYKKTSQAVTVAVIDSGCNLDHPDLKDNLLADLAWDCVSGKSLASQKASIGNGGDNNGHGTMVCGVIGAKANNGVGVAGTSYDAKVLPLRVMNSSGLTYTSYLIKALQKVEEYINAGSAGKLKVINMSLGGYTNDPTFHSWVQCMRNVYKMTIVCAGGNGDENGNPITAPCYPSDYDECIGVTALTQSGAHSYWADYNPSKDISAPGEAIATTSMSGGYASAGGSSFSAPIVSGIAALVLAACPDATPADIYNALRESALPISGAARPYNGSAGAVNAIGALAYMGVDTSATYYWTPSYESAYSPIYSYMCYRGSYSDLRSAFGYNRRLFVTHYLNNGMNEGRRGNTSFDVASYYNANPDLRRAFGTDLKSLTMHYVSNGRREGRTTSGVSAIRGFANTYVGTNWSPVYDGQYYYDNNADLRSAFLVKAGNLRLYDDLALLAHFVNNGIPEGRRGSEAFDVASYYNANPDLRAAFGPNLRSLYDHYISNGKSEGRRATGVASLQGFVSTLNGVNYSLVYNGQYYYDSYPDLRSAYTRKIVRVTLFDDKGLLEHFVLCGIPEGRRGSEAFDVASYYNANPDLRAAFGVNLSALYSHYLSNGRREGRTANGVSSIRGFLTTLGGTNYSAVYDGQYYYDHNADLRNAYNRRVGRLALFDDKGLLEHFVLCGMAEGRQASASFKVQTYRSRYADLRIAFGANLRLYYFHFMTNGIREGRKAV